MRCLAWSVLVLTSCTAQPPVAPTPAPPATVPIATASGAAPGDALPQQGKPVLIASVLDRERLEIVSAHLANAPGELFQSCYAVARERDRGVAGWIEIGIEFADDRSVSETTLLRDSDLPPALRACLLDSARSIKIESYEPLVPLAVYVSFGLE